MDPAFTMPPLMFRCPTTSKLVQAWYEEDADDAAADDDGEFESIVCHACGQPHLVNPKNGKVVGGDG